ncbi:MAG: alcohol dehydrogenase [Deltaproteobacteria bacterium]|nr:MAG: alcohol dehydrogenase [Deltaproteobacteria bacterium]
METVNIFRTTGRILMGVGSLSRIGDELKQLGANHVLVITDKGLVQSGIVGKLEGILKDSSVDYEIFDGVKADPNYEIIYDTVKIVKKNEIDTIIGIGGGSSLDIAKVTSVSATNEGDITEFFGIDRVENEGLKTVLVPTTAGTGSEVTPIAILSDIKEKLKKGVVSSYLLPDVAILDASLTVSLPPKVTASTGMDALIHAIEAFTSIHATFLTDDLAVKAIDLIFNNIRTAYANGVNLEAREGMLLGSMLAGMAFANAGVTAVHAFAYPIGAEFHIPHGVANTIMLIPVMKFNFLGNLSKFAKLASLLGEKTERLSERAAAEKTIEALEVLADDLNVPRHLREFGVEEKHIDSLAEGAMKVTRLLSNNPRILSLEDARGIYRLAL